MPYLKKIFQYSDVETQKNLKLVNKAFWKEHALSKFRNNFSPAQEARHKQLYCHGPCPNVDHFEVNFFSSLNKKRNLFRIVMNRSFSLPIEVRFALKTSQEQDKVG